MLPPPSESLTFSPSAFEEGHQGSDDNTDGDGQGQNVLDNLRAGIGAGDQGGDQLLNHDEDDETDGDRNQAFSHVRKSPDPFALIEL